MSSEAPVDYSIVVPCYRDAEGLDVLFERVGEVMDQLPGTGELVLVDDGSPDRTGPLAIEHAREFRQRTTVVRLARNFGQHPAVFAGFEHARGQVIITMDSDLQYPPDEIRRLMEGLSPEFPVVSGRRVDRRDPWLRRRLSSALSWWLAKQTGSQLADFGSMFRAYDRTVIERLLALPERRRYIPALVAWLGVPVKEIPVRHEARGSRGTRYRLAPLVDMALDVVTGYSVFPLRMLSILGLLASTLGFVVTLGFAVYRIFVGAGEARLVSAFAAIFFLIGVQLAVSAMISEYVGRVYIEAKGRPLYVVGEVQRNR
jgi:undecaprenyl-phosphate 4-deoxy-4-formamido-L-arabinose transferase